MSPSSLAVIQSNKQLLTDFVQSEKIDSQGSGTCFFGRFKKL